MKSTIKIKRKLKVKVLDKDHIVNQSEKKYLGFIFIYYNTKKPNNSEKILLNHSYIYLLNNNKFLLDEIGYEIPINNEFIYQHLQKYQLEKSSISSIKPIYEINNYTIYNIALNEKDSLFIEKFSWRLFLDFYTYDKDSTFDDIYYNVVFKDSNLHLNYKFYSNNWVKSYIKLHKIYTNLIGDNIVKHPLIETKHKISKFEKNMINLKKHIKEI